MFMIIVLATNIPKMLNKKYEDYGGRRFEPGTSRTQNGNHTPRPTIRLKCLQISIYYYIPNVKTSKT